MNERDRVSFIKSIRILGIVYNVSCENTEKKGNRVPGSVDVLENNITIDSYLNSSEHASSVLLHEIIEVLDYRLELNLKHEKITQLEAGLIQVFRDNPKLLGCLFGLK